MNIDGVAMVIPTMYARVGDIVYVHGAAANRTLGALRAGAEASFVVTLLDGLVMARSAFNHSMNYRSVVVVGPTVEVTDKVEKLRAMEALVEHVAPGRWADSRQPTEAEIASTVILALRLDEASAKVRTGPPLDDAADAEFPTWAGVIPLALVSDAPLTAPGVAVELEIGLCQGLQEAPRPLGIRDRAEIAQLVERRPEEAGVGGSNPSLGTSA